eukprot:m51a1_g14645 hypothetical protein (626) ;mRNA; f:69422-72608
MHYTDDCTDCSEDRWPGIALDDMALARQVLLRHVSIFMGRHPAPEELRALVTLGYLRAAVDAAPSSRLALISPLVADCLLSEASPVLPRAAEAVLSRSELWFCGPRAPFFQAASPRFGAQLAPQLRGIAEAAPRHLPKSADAIDLARALAECAGPAAAALLGRELWVELSRALKFCLELRHDPALGRLRALPGRAGRPLPGRLRAVVAAPERRRGLGVAVRVDRRSFSRCAPSARARRGVAGEGVWAELVRGCTAEDAALCDASFASGCIAILLAAVSVWASASEFSLSFVGNISVSDTSDAADLHYRSTTMFSATLPLLLNGAVFLSVSVDATGRADNDSASASASSNGIWAFGGVYADSVPTAWYGFYEGSIDGSFQSVANLDLKGSAGFAGAAYTSLVERNSTGDIVAVTSLEQGGTITWTQTSSASANGAHWYQMNGTSATSELNVLVTYILSDRMGQLSYASAIAAPKVLETVVEIHDYPYASADNTLELVVVSATAGATVQGSALVADGEVTVFADLKATALVDGLESSVSISTWAEVNLTALATAEVLVNKVAVATGKATAEVGAHVASIRFSAGANAIVYDPALGNGVSPYELSASSAAPAVPVALALVALLAARLF